VSHLSHESPFVAKSSAKDYSKARSL